MARVQVIIDQDGNVTIENTEITGTKCAEVSDKLALALGEKESQSFKDEYYVPLPDYAEVDGD